MNTPLQVTSPFDIPYHSPHIRSKYFDVTYFDIHLNPNLCLLALISCGYFRYNLVCVSSSINTNFKWGLWGSSSIYLISRSSQHLFFNMLTVYKYRPSLTYFPRCFSCVFSFDFPVCFYVFLRVFSLIISFLFIPSLFSSLAIFSFLLFLFSILLSEACPLRYLSPFFSSLLWSPLKLHFPSPLRPTYTVSTTAEAAFSTSSAFPFPSHHSPHFHFLSCSIGDNFF